ncbi:MAG: ABC transporter permease [Chloroflexia bacterium]
MATRITEAAAIGQTGTAVSRFGLLLQANLVMYVRNRTALFWSLAFPIALILLFGSIFGNQSGAGKGVYIAFLTTGMIVLSLLANGLIGNASAMAVWRERGILRRIQSTPLPLWQFLLARIVTQGGIMVVQAFVLVATSILVFGAKYDALNLLIAIPSVIGGALLFMAFGQAVAALARKVETVNIITQVVYFPLMFLGGLMIPLAQLPDWLQAVGKYLPSAMMADLIRTPMVGQSLGQALAPSLPLPADLLGVVIYFAAAVFVAVRFFKWS